MAGLLIIDKELSVDRGAETVCACKIKNTGSVVDQFSVQVMGAPAAWSVAEPQSISLFPGAEGVINIRMKPPDAVKAGKMPFGVKLASATEPTATVVEEGTIAVGAFVAVTARIVPRVRKARSAGKHKLVVKNTGNAPARVRINGSDPDEVIRFKGLGGAPILLAPGARQEVPIRYRSTASHLTGPPENHQFTISVVPEGGEPVAVPGTMLQKAAISGFMIMALAAVVAVIALVLILKSLQGSGVKTLATTQAGANGSGTPTPSASSSGSATANTTATNATSTGSSAAGGAGAAAGAGAPQHIGGLPPPPPPPQHIGSGGGPAPPPLFPYVSSGWVSITRGNLFIARNGGAQPLAGADPSAIAGRWSPDGKSILWYASCSSVCFDQVEVGSFNTNTGAVSAIHTVATNCACWADWTPDGASITYLTSASGGDNIMIVPASGGTPRALTPSPVTATASGWMAWTPDGQFLLYSASSCPGLASPSICKVPAAGGASSLVAPIQTNSLAIKPDFSMIAWTFGGNLFAASFNRSLQVTNVHEVGLPTGASGAQYPVFERTGQFIFAACSTGICASHLSDGAASIVGGTTNGDTWPDA